MLTTTTQLFTLKLKVSLILFFLLNFINQSIAQIEELTVIHKTNEVQKVGTNTLFLEDPDGSLTFEDVLKSNNQTQFKKIDKDVFNAPSSESVFWFKMTLKNDTNEDIWLEVGDAFMIETLDFYSSDLNGEFGEPLLLGSLRDLSNKQFPSSHFCVKLQDSNQAHTYYLRLTTVVPKLYVFQVGTTYAITQYLDKYKFGTISFLAIVLAMFLYNAFIYFSTRDKIYLIYIGYLITIAFNVPFYMGNPIFHIPWLWHNVYLWHFPMFFFMALFAIVYLKLKVTLPKLFWYWFLLVIGIISIVFPIVDIFSGDPGVYPFFNVAAAVFSLTMLASGIIAWVKGNKNARFYVLAWVFVFVGNFLFIFTSEGIIPFNPFTRQGIYFGYALETLFFALALGDRLNTLRKDKESAQNKNIKLIATQNERLELKVKERTQELQVKQEEILTQNEELRQTQEELQTQRDYIEQRNKDLAFKNAQINQSIHAAETIQQAILPSNNAFKEYFKDYFLIFKPKDIVSGDFYWLSKQNNTLWLAVADCTGHGVPGAFMTLLGKNILDNIINVKNVETPAEVLEKLDYEIKTVLRQEETGSNVGMDLILLKLDLTDSNKIAVTFSGAKSMLYVFHESYDKLLEYKGDRIAIGGSRKINLNFTNQQFNIEQNTSLYLASDGFQDQNDVHRRSFKRSKLKEFLFENASTSFANQKDLLLSTLDSHMEGTDQRDDILLLAVKV